MPLATRWCWRAADDNPTTLRDLRDAAWISAFLRVCAAATTNLHAEVTAGVGRQRLAVIDDVAMATAEQADETLLAGSWGGA